MPTALSPIGFVLLWLATRIFGLGVQGASGAYTVMLGASFFFWFQFLTRMITRESSRSTISRSIVLVAAICVMASDAFISAIRLGQPSILVVGVVGLVTLGARRLIPFLLVLSSIKPHYFLLAISLAAVCRAWREMAYGFVTLAFLTVAGVSLFGASLIEEYPQVLLRYARGMSFAWYTNPLSVGPILGIAPQMLGGLGSVLGVLVAVWAVWSRSIITTALIPVVYLLTSPYVGNYEQVLLLVPLVAWSSRSTGLVGNDSPTTTKRLARIDES